MIVVNLLSNTQQVPVSVCQSWGMARFLPTFKIISKYQLSKHRKRIKRRNFKFFAMKMIVHALKKKKENKAAVLCFFLIVSKLQLELIFCWKDFKHALKYRIVCRLLAPSIFFVFFFLYCCFLKTRFFFLLLLSILNPITYIYIHTQWLSVINCGGQRWL